MDSPFQRARDLLAGLFKRRTSLDPPKDDGDAPGLARDSFEPGERAVIPYLAMLLDGAPAERAAAGETIASILIHATGDELVLIDETMRGRYIPLQHGWEWDHFDASRVLSGPNDAADLVLLKLLSMHPNGRVREAAVEHLAVVHDGSEIPFLLLRLNDWVPQVRARARAVVRERLVPSSARSFVGASPLLMRLLNARRVDHHEILRDIAKVITNAPDGRDALIAAMTGDDRGRRHAALRIAALNSAADFESFILPGSKMADPMVRLFVARAVAVGRHGHVDLARLKTLAIDPFASVRHVALIALATHFRDEATPQLESAVMDRSAAIRDFARFEIRKRGEVDFAWMYREAIAGASTVRLAAAIAGLGETGERSDAEAVLPFLEHPNASVRLASVRTVVHLGGERFIQEVLPRLSDPATSVASLAVKMLSRYVAAIGGVELQTRFRASAEPRIRVNLLRMIAALPKWESIRMLLDAATDRDAAVASVAREYVLRWMARYNRSSIAPSNEQVKLVRAAIANAGSALKPKLIQEILFTLDSWR